MDDYLYSFSSALPAQQQAPELDPVLDVDVDDATLLAGVRASKPKPAIVGGPIEAAGLEAQLGQAHASVDASRRKRADSWPPAPIAIASRDVADGLPDDLAYAYIDDSDSEIDDDELDALADEDLLVQREKHVVQLEACRRVLEQASAVLATLMSIKAGFDAVAAQTSSLQARCEGLQAEEQQLSTLADEIRSRLRNFAHLTEAERLLNAPGSELVARREYGELLTKLQHSIDFLAAHPDYHDADAFRTRYGQNLARALALGKTYFVDRVREVTGEIVRMMQVNAVNQNTRSALLYTKFRSVAGKVRPSVRNIERASLQNDDYEGLLEDCLTTYFNARRQLQAPIVAAAYRDVATVDQLAPFGAACISFVRVAASDERDLFEAFFGALSAGSARPATDELCHPIARREFDRFISWLAQGLSEALRPRIAAESGIGPLCELVGAMQSQCRSAYDDYDGAGSDSRRFDMTTTLRVPLGEARTKLIRRARETIRTDVGGYKPSDRDLSYPELIDNPSMSRAAGGNRALVDNGLDSGLMPADWYPSLRVSLSLLGKVHRLMPAAAFRRLCGVVVRACVASLSTAAQAVRRRAAAARRTDGVPTHLDADLFLLRHLLILKEQIAQLELEDQADLDHNPDALDHAGGAAGSGGGGDGEKSIWWEAQTEIASGLYSLASRLVGIGGASTATSSAGAAAAGTGSLGRAGVHARQPPGVALQNTRYASSPAAVGRRTSDGAHDTAADDAAADADGARAMQELDEVMRGCIGSLTARAADDLVAVLRQNTNTSTAGAATTGSGGNPSAGGGEKATREMVAKLQDAHERYRSTLLSGWIAVNARCTAFVRHDDRVVRALMRIVRDRLLEGYERFSRPVLQQQQQKQQQKQQKQGDGDGDGDDDAQGGASLPTVLEEAAWLDSLTGLSAYSDDEEGDDDDDDDNEAAYGDDDDDRDRDGSLPDVEASPSA